MSYMKKYIKNIYCKLKDFFAIPQAPVGLSAMGIKMNYLDNINNFNYSTSRFCSKILSPVNTPYFLE